MKNSEFLGNVEDSQPCVEENHRFDKQVASSVEGNHYKFVFKQGPVDEIGMPSRKVEGLLKKIKAPTKNLQTPLSSNTVPPTIRPFANLRDLLALAVNSSPTSSPRPKKPPRFPGTALDARAA